MFIKYNIFYCYYITDPEKDLQSAVMQNNSQVFSFSIPHPPEQHI